MSINLAKKLGTITESKPGGNNKHL